MFTVSLISLFVQHTYVVEVIPGLDELRPEGEDLAGPARKEQHALREGQHVVGCRNEAECVCWNLFLKTAQTGLKQDGGNSWTKGKKR